ncbi:MAG: glycosyltransferase family 4 protein [Candidatus Colwellbacteria bacterium]|nr:glycosyltransferase family 4 protein [Candidatus Colwellbacteria bacterium]
MKIALIAPFEESVPPEKYGGTELVVYNLAEGLIDKGHDVFLLASGDSQTRAKIIPIFPRAIRKEEYASDTGVRNAVKFVGISRILDELKKINIDIIHNHLGWRLLPFSNNIGKPVVTTLHGPLDVPYQQFVYGLFSDASYISISNSQREPFNKLNFVSTVYNGIDISLFDFNETPQDHLVFLGRMSPEKGPKLAIEIAKKAGKKLVMAAKVDAVDKDYFEKEIEPLIDGEQIQFIGEIGPEEKNGLLRNATALLAPIQWREPFGLFMAEAMACGTPVIVTDMGSARELVIDGKTGFVVRNDVNEFIEAVSKITEIKREVCRKHVENKFTLKIMVDKYEEAYKKVLNK